MLVIVALKMTQKFDVLVVHGEIYQLQITTITFVNQLDEWLYVRNICTPCIATANTPTPMSCTWWKGGNLWVSFTQVLVLWCWIVWRYMLVWYWRRRTIMGCYRGAGPGSPQMASPYWFVHTPYITQYMYTLGLYLPPFWRWLDFIYLNFNLELTDLRFCGFGSFLFCRNLII
jgi:hypothetical protein